MLVNLQLISLKELTLSYPRVAIFSEDSHLNIQQNIY